MIKMLKTSFHVLQAIRPQVRHYSKPYRLSLEVEHALQTGKPVVALESTIISHGMPYPRNLQVAKLVEDTVRSNGAIPATIAIIDGIPRIGLNSEELEILAKGDHLGDGKEVHKVSRRDLAYVCASGLNGATTVSGTMILADLAGIRVFATGGIGGVHRGAEVTMDVSADLTELARTPVTVVCAGIKSILDVPKTLEYLETQGVPVLGLDVAEERERRKQEMNSSSSSSSSLSSSSSSSLTSTSHQKKKEKRQFPGFFTNDSGAIAPLWADSPELIARMMVEGEKLMGQKGGAIGGGRREGGIVVGVPNPNPAQTEEIHQAISQALLSAKDKGIEGRDVTPYILEAVRAATGGRSLDSNISLVLNNAKIACEIAKEYERIKLIERERSGLHSSSSIPSSSTTTKTISSSSVTSSSSSPSFPPSPRVVVVGGAVVDTVASIPPLPSSSSPSSSLFNGSNFILGSSNPGHISQSYGGVGRNLCEGLVREHMRRKSEKESTKKGEGKEERNEVDGRGEGGGVALLSVVGDDDGGRGLLSHAVRLIHTQQDEVLEEREVREVMSGGVDVSRVLISSRSLSSPLQFKEFQSKSPSSISPQLPNNPNNSTSSTTSPTSPSTLTTTASYVAIHAGQGGEMVAGVADMRILSLLTPSYLLSQAGLLRSASLLAVDGNLPLDSFLALMKLAASMRVPLFFEPTSDFKCLLPFLTRTIHLVDVMKPNRGELVAMMKRVEAEGWEGIPNKAVLSASLRRLTGEAKPIEGEGDSSSSSSTSSSSSSGRVNGIEDLRVLACGLLRLMMRDGSRGARPLPLPQGFEFSAEYSPNSPIIPTTPTSSSSSSSQEATGGYLMYTGEGSRRCVQGKHVFVSLGEGGILWVGSKTVLGRAADIVVDDEIACKLISLPQMDSFFSRSESAPSLGVSIKHTSGAGDAFCAGLISSLVDRATTPLGTSEIPLLPDLSSVMEGLRASQRHLVRVNQK